MMLILLFIFDCLGFNRCDIQPCSITSDNNIHDEVNIDMPFFGYSFWYRYKIVIEGDYDFIIFEESGPSFGDLYFSFTISLKNLNAKHEFHLQNQIIWDSQLIRPILQDQDWHFFMIYYQLGSIQIKIITSDSSHTGISIWPFTILKMMIRRNIFYPQVQIIICGEQSEFLKDLQLLKNTEIQKCQDSLRQEIQLEYSPDFNNFMSQQFNPKKAIITAWFRDFSANSSFTITLLSALTDQQQITSQQHSFNLSKISTHHLNYTYLNLKKFNQSFHLSNPIRNDLISAFTLLDQKELLMWYFIKLEPEKELQVQTINQVYTINSSLEFSLPNTQLQVNVSSTIFTQLYISQSVNETCSPNCLQCSDTFTCSQCKGNRISPSCICIPGTYDFGGIDCEYMHLKLELTQIDTYNAICPIGYLECGERITCTKDYTMYQNKCYKWQLLIFNMSPQLGDEICQQCIISSEINQRFICKYVSNENLKRYSQGNIDDTMLFFTLQIFDDEPYQILTLASISIMYQFEQAHLNPIKYQYYVKYAGTIQKYTCPYNYKLVLSSNLKDVYFCLKTPKNCLKLDIFQSLDYQWCQLCKSKYSLIDNECIKCPQNCQSCNMLQCTSCVDGYFISYNGICKKCNIRLCEICYEYSQGYLSIQDNIVPYSISSEPQVCCAKCFQGYEFNYQTRQCQVSVSKCEIAIYNEKQICLVGSESQFITTSCIFKNCDLCYKQSCVRCAVGYYVTDSKQCKECRFQYSVNSDQTFILDCQLFDPINYQEYKQSLQHIFVLHYNTLYTQPFTQIQLKQCMNGEVLYDIAKCQADNNINHKQYGLCSSYIKQPNGQSYCLEVNQNLDGIVIDRVSGKVKYCNGYSICDIKKQYNITVNIFGLILYKDMIFHSTASFIQSLNIEFLKEQSIVEIDLYLTLQTQNLLNILCICEIPLNLYIDLNLIASLYLYLQPQQYLTIGYFLNIFFERVDYLYQSMIIHCKNLYIKRYNVQDIQSTTTFDIQRVYLIWAEKLEIEEIIMIRTKIIPEILSERSIKIIIQLLSIQDCQFDRNTSQIFQPEQAQAVFVNIIDFRILSSSNIQTTLFADEYQVVTIQIKQFIISRYEMHNSSLIIALNITIDTIFIYNSNFYNSTVFHTQSIYIGQLKIINCTFVDSYLIQNHHSNNYQSSQYIFDYIQLSRIISNRSQIIDFKGQLFQSNTIIIYNFTNYQSKLESSFIQIRSIDCQVHNLEVFDISLNHMTLISIQSQNIIIQNVSISRTPNVFAKLNDSQIIIPDDAFAVYICFSDFVNLYFTHVYIGQFYVRYPIIKINSTQSIDIFLKTVTFDQLQVFSSKIIEIQGYNINIYNMSFKNIWFHSLIEDSSQQDLLLECIGFNLIIDLLSFWQIKNTKSNSLQWVFLQGTNIQMFKILVQQFQFPINKFYHEEQNQTIIDTISKQTGQNQPMNIISESLKINILAIYYIESSSLFLINMNFPQVIERLEIHNIKILSRLNTQYSGIFYSEQLINYVNISNITSKSLQVDHTIFYLKVVNYVLFNNISLNMNTGGLIYCESIALTYITLQNIVIYQSLNVTNLYQKGRIAIEIVGGIIRIYELVIKHSITDVLYLKSFSQIHLSSIFIKEVQAMMNLVLIESTFCVSVIITDIIISHHQVYFLNGQSNVESLIKLKTNGTYQSVLKNIVLNKNSNISSLISFIDGNNFTISNFYFINNVCSEFCLISDKEQHNFYQGRRMELESSFLSLIDGIIIGNSGPLINFIVGQIQLKQLLIIHKGMIYSKFTQNQMIQLIEGSQLIYNSDNIIELNSIMLNSTFVMNEQFQQIQSTNSIVLTLSFDGGNTQYPTINDIVIFYKSQKIVKNHCYFPTGQSLGVYERLNFQKYTYQSHIKEMKFALRGSSQTNLQCILSYQQKQQRFQMDQQNWKDFTLVAEPKSMIKFQITCTNYNLQFFVKVLDCQLGEIYLNSSCLRCDSSRNQYSVQKNSSQCLTKTHNIDQVQSGLIKLKPGYWRPFLSSSQIEQCDKLEACLGGWKVGDHTCLAGYFGGLCSACDIYSQRGYGHYVLNSWNQCEVCQTRFRIIFYICIILMIQIILLYFNNKSWERDCKQFRNNTILVKYYRSLIKYQVDHTQVTIKLFTNFLQQFLVITSNSQFGLPVFLSQVFYQYSNPSISIWQEVQCFYAKEISSFFIVQAKPLIIVVVSIIVLNVYLFLHFILIIIRICNYHFRNFGVSVYYLTIFNYTNYYEMYIFNNLFRLIALTSWRNISGLRWVNDNISISYDQQGYIQKLYIFLLPQIALSWVLPLIVLKILHLKKKSLIQLKTYCQWGFLYRQFKLQSYNEEILLTWIKLTIITIAYQLSNQALYRLSALLVSIVFYKILQEHRTPYQFSKFNRLNINLQYSSMAFVILFTLLNEQRTYENIKTKLIIYILIIITLLVTLYLILKQLIGSIHYTYRWYIDNFKMIVSQKLPNLSNSFPTFFSCSLNRHNQIKANFDKMRPKNLQQILSRLSRPRNLPSNQQYTILQNTIEEQSYDQVEQLMLQLNDLVRIEASIEF